jgi:hypothetical protein
MPRLLRLPARTALLSLVTLLQPAVAGAQSVATMVQDFGLVGTWAAKCDQTPSAANEHAVFSITPAGTVQLVNDFGPLYDDMVYRIVHVERLNADQILLRQVLSSDPNVVLDIVMMRDNGKVRVWSSRSADGTTTLVRNGRIAKTNGQATQWVTSCKDRWAVNPPATAN